MHGAAAPRGRPGTGSAAAPATSRTVQSPSFSELGNMRRGRPQGVGAGVVRDGHHGDVGALAAGHAGRTDGPHSHAAPPRHDVRAGTLHQPPQVDPPPTPSPPPARPPQLQSVLRRPPLDRWPAQRSRPPTHTRSCCCIGGMVGGPVTRALATSARAGWPLGEVGGPAMSSGQLLQQSAMGGPWWDGLGRGRWGAPAV